jgi:hypothetical protein
VPIFPTPTQIDQPNASKIFPQQILRDRVFRKGTMKAICAQTNPAFKQRQLLPLILNLLPPTTGGAARHFSEFTPAANQSAPAERPSPPHVPAATIRANQPAIRLRN